MVTGQPLLCRGGEQAPVRVRQGQAGRGTRTRDVWEQQAGRSHGEPMGGSGSHGDQTLKPEVRALSRTESEVRAVCASQDYNDNKWANETLLCPKGKDFFSADSPYASPMPCLKSESMAL